MTRAARPLRRAAAGAASRLPPSLTAAALRAARLAARREEPFGWFERDDGRRLPLLTGYREHGKGRWRAYWWATRALLALDSRGARTDDARRLVEALRAGSTLPAPLEAFAAEAAALSDAFPHLLRPTGRTDRTLGVPILASVPTDEEIVRTARVYSDGARAVAAALERMGVELPAARVLEAGCGRGYTAAALAAAGTAEVVGVDLDVVGEVLPDEVERVRAALSAGRPPRIETGDLRRLPYPDGAFDAVYSVAVFEHVSDVTSAFAELRRVTRPGGVGYHGIDVWFGTAGGHSLCTLDAPWGHVRLGEGEFARYVSELRPYEAEDALSQYEHGLQRPRLTLRETADAARGAGFEVVSATLTRLPLRDRHRAWFDGEILRDCRRRYPAVKADDLLSVSGTLVLRRPR